MEGASADSSCSCPAPPSALRPLPPLAAQVEIDSVEKFEALRAAERAYFDDMVQRCKDAGATLVICQWGERAGS